MSRRRSPVGLVAEQPLPLALTPHLATVPWAVGATELVLAYAAGRLELRHDGEALAVDFLSGRVGWRGARARHERLVRACGVRRPDVRVLDGTGGLGVDAWLLAEAGARVTLVEQDPVLVALLADGLRRAAATREDVVRRIRLVCDDSRARLVREASGIDVAYFDPMYPARRKRALGDRRLRRVAALLAAGGSGGGEPAELVRTALAAGVPRVVLKRPLRAPAPDAGRRPSHTLAGRSTRFDVWVG